MPQEQSGVTSPIGTVLNIDAVRVFDEAAGGEWLPVGSARGERHQGRDVLRVMLDASPTIGRLCVALADLDVIRQEASGVC